MLVRLLVHPSVRLTSVSSSVAVQLVFLVLQLTGLYRWKKGVSKDMRATCRRLTAKEGALLVIGWFVSVLVLGYILQWYGGNLPYLDALGTTGNLLAQVVMIMGHPECWLIYMTTNVAYISVSFLSGLYVYFVLYSVYMVVATRGWRQWNALLKEREERENRSQEDALLPATSEQA